MKNIRRLAYVAGLTLLLSGISVATAVADTVYTNLGEGGTFDDSNGYLVGGFMQVIAHQFTPGAEYTFTDAVLPLGIRSGSLRTIVVFLMADSDGLPGDILEMITLEVPFPWPGAQLVTAVSGKNPTLAADTPYWLVAVGPATDTVWDFNSTGDLSTGSNFAFNQLDSPTGPWALVGPGDVRSAFQIDGDPIAGPAPSRPSQPSRKAPLTASDSAKN